MTRALAESLQADAGRLARSLDTAERQSNVRGDTSLNAQVSALATVRRMKVALASLERDLASPEVRAAERSARRERERQRRFDLAGSAVAV